jgi:hypothetical protein
MTDTFAPLPNWLLRRPDISASAKIVFARLRQYQGENADCWPSVQTMSAEVGIAGRNVIKQLQALERHGLIVVTRRTGTSNRYRLATGDEIATRDGNVTSDRNITGTHDVSITGTSDGNITPPVTETSPKENKKTSPKKSSEKTKVVFEVPPSLRTSAFAAAWDQWLRHRSEIRKPLKTTAAAAQLRKLEAMGPDRATAAIEHSIAAGWTGIFEPTTNNNRNPKNERLRISTVQLKQPEQL